jgi:lambda family phage portal protein
MRTRDRVADVLTLGAVTRQRVARVAAKSRARNERIREEKVQIQARYEAAYYSLSRSYLPAYIQSAREDISALPRQEIMRRVRYFEKNSAVLTKILSLLDVNVIGTGITPSPSTVNAGWNKLAQDWWTAWAQKPDITGQSTLAGLQSIIYRARKVDGDVFVKKLLSSVGRPVLEVAEAHRVGTGSIDGNAIARAGFKLVDGVIVDSQLRPSAYTIADDFDQSVIRTMPASSVRHFFKKMRSGQYRGISTFHAAILDLHDSDDLQKYEMRAAKDAASISKIIELAAGATTTDGMGMGSAVANTANTGDITARQTMYRQALGAETLLTQPGDKVNQFQFDRPSAAMTGFWDRLDNKIVQASGVSYAALVDYKGNWGGATLRAAVQSDNRLFNLETMAEAEGWQDIWEWAIGWAMQVGELPFNPDFKNVRWHPPRRTTVDIGNDSDAMINELKGGLKSYEVIYGEGGEDWKERLEQRAKEEAFINDLAARYNVDRQYIASFAQERLAGQAPDAVGPGSPPNGQPPATKKGGKGQ